MGIEGQLKAHYALVEEHLLQHFQQEEVTVFEEIKYWGIPIDVYRVRPANASFQMLVTSGMSTLPMETEDENSAFRFSELMMILPRDWEFSKEVPEDSAKDWPVTVLKQLARFPFEHKTCAGIGHTVLFNSHFQPFDPSVDFVATMLIPSVTFPSEFTTVQTESDPIRLYTVFPLFREEWAFKQRKGYDATIDLFIRFGLTELADPNRPNVIMHLPND